MIKMEKLLTILILFYSCQKPAIIIKNIISNAGKGIYLNKDTTVNGTWDGGWKVFNPVDAQGNVHKVYGIGTLTRWIINAPYTADIFDTSINLVNIKCYTDVFSCAWYGAKSSNSDNYWNIQKSINTSLANSLECLLPKGFYNYSKGLEIQQIYKGAYVGCTLHFYGKSSFWDSRDGSTLNFTGTSGSALNLQLNKGSEIDHLTIIGQFKSPQTSDSIYFNTAYDDFKDASGKNCNEWYHGISIDDKPPLDGVSNSGSTGLKIHDMWITKFTHLIAISQNTVTQNAEILLFENIHLGEGKTGFVTGQAQEKGNMIKGVYAWDRLHTVFSIGKHGNWQAGDYHIDGGNLAGHVIRVFDISQSAWFSTSVENLFCEGVGTIGTLYTWGLPMQISNCTFDFKFINQIGKQVLLNSNSHLINFSSCNFRYYNNLYEEMDFEGVASFDPFCYFSGKKV